MDTGDRPSADDTDDVDDEEPDPTADETGDRSEPSTDAESSAESEPTPPAAGSTESAESTSAAASAESTSAAASAESASPSPSTATPSSTPSSAASNAAPEPEPGTTAADDSKGGPIHRFRTANHGPLMWLREMLSSAAVVLAIGLLLFTISGVWPPMVAVESGSMEPNMVKGDLVFVTEPGRVAPDAATNDIGVVTYQQGGDAGYSTFGNPGSVIVYRQPGRVGSPIIHRARFHVEAGENWYDRADKDHIRADNCEQLTNCPAPHAGFITKGDNNPQYDQANGIAPPVKADWVTGVARVRIPYLGWVRLIATGQATTVVVTPGMTMVAAGASAVGVSRPLRSAA